MTARIRLELKRWVEHLPEHVSRPLSRVPFSLRFGRTYARSCQDLLRVERLSSDEREALAVKRLKKILTYAYERVPFYQEHYIKQGFHPDHFRELNDWDKVPIVSKENMRSVLIAGRVVNTVRGMQINTGGTSGQPLEFLVDAQAFAREWAHMHHIWSAHGYRPSHLKLTFRGKHFNRAEVLRYNAVHNEYIVNSNCSMTEIVSAVRNLTEVLVVRWLHGYPSLIAEFAECVNREDSDLADFLRRRLYGVLLGSEYPANIYRSRIESILSSNVVSWYGHSEMVLLARETARGVYTALPSYGFAEAIREDKTSHSCRLVGTCFYNRAHPFVRYDTGDLVMPLSHERGILSFQVLEGRVGDFVIGRDGRRISLTAIIFGRHHPGFADVHHVQVRQDDIGSITLLVVADSKRTSPEDLHAGFNLDDVDIDWRIEVIDKPIRSMAGKIKLLVN